MGMPMTTPIVLTMPTPKTSTVHTHFFFSFFL